MNENLESTLDALSTIQITANPNNEPVTVLGFAEGMRCIGVGTDAAVFHSSETPEYAFKVYANEKREKIAVEAEVYKQLGDSPYFPTCYAATASVLIVSYEPGITFFDCILQGISIPKEAVEDVEKAREYVRSKGLNPRDIHLKNVLLQDGRAKIIDVSEYVLPGNDNRWEDLKRGYEDYYHLFEGRAVPFWMVETVRKWYNNRSEGFSYEDFANKVMRFFIKK
ncbi:serine/threonine-protein kinase RIO1 [Chryseomicrobium aureum]|uniref:serine/threonine protein kinase n=1 Tax=Chryseomicrobium aureum TaxID=1441723 RepID=UPI00195C7A95|nr:serine/threonine protein kinase [Chryseomicrobium aureum]MBM7706014.1 serine/threonine-protein kinase RIO1 [Chryseomicrobium aureum]